MSVVNLLDREDYRLDFGPGVALDVPAVCRALIIACIRDVGAGAGKVDAPPPPPGQPRETRLQAQRRHQEAGKVRNLCASIAWLNGGPAVLDFEKACAILDRDPARLRKALGAALGLPCSGPAHKLQGPYTLAHQAAAVALLRRLDDTPAPTPTPEA